VGLGLLIDAPIRARGWLGRRPTGTAVISSVDQAFRAGIDDPLLAAHARLVRDGETLSVHLHPAAGPIEVRVDGERVVCSAQTSDAGPGYHAYVVELVERVGERAGLTWRWTDGDGERGDECGFHESRDFAALQREMLGWLRQLCAVLVERGAGPFQVCMPVEVRPLRATGVCTPLGPRPAEWATTVATASDDELAAHGAAFFPWWGRALDAAFWHGYGSALAWVDVPWHACDGDGEAAIYGAALAAFDRARALDPRIELPARELAELRRLADPDADPDVAPARDGIGYRRGAMRWRLAGGWWMTGPGYWYESHDEDGTITRHFADRAIHVTSYSASSTADQLLARARERMAAADPARVVSWRDGELQAIGLVSWDDADRHWLLQGEVATDGKLCVATFVYHDDADRSWAEEIFRSITRPGAGTPRD